MEKITIDVANAQGMFGWLQTRGGIACWRSVNLNNPGAMWYTPANRADGTPAVQPIWQADTKPEQIIKLAEDVIVSIDEEFKRFHVALKHGDGLNWVCTSESTSKINKALADAGEGSYCDMDYFTQEAVIMKSTKTTSLADYAKEQGWE